MNLIILEKTPHQMTNQSIYIISTKITTKKQISFEKWRKEENIKE